MGRIAVVALGSNLGDRHAHLELAISRLRQFLEDIQVSPVHETEPVGVTGDQPPFLNAAVVGRTTLDAAGLLRALLTIERDAGRERPFPGAARTLDLDLILCGESVIDQPDLHVPHPRFRERRFVLEPLAEIAPGLKDPVTGLTVSELLGRLGPPAR